MAIFMAYKINGGDPNYLLNGMILQVCHLGKAQNQGVSMWPVSLHRVVTVKTSAYEEKTNERCRKKSFWAWETVAVFGSKKGGAFSGEKLLDCQGNPSYPPKATPPGIRG